MKHLKLFFALFAMLALGVGNAWAEEVTFNFKTIAQTSGTTGGISWETGKTGSATNTACNSTNGLVLYGVASGGGYFQTKSPTSGAITNVSITSSAKKNTPKYTIYGSTDGSTWTSIESGITAGTKDHAITGAYTYFKIANTTAATAQLAITTLTITYETAGGETPGEGGGEEPTPDPEEPTPGTGSSTGWVETAIGNITSSDIVVVTMTNSSATYAMSNDKGTGSAPTAVKVTVNGDKLSEEPADNLKWNITNSSGSLTIYPNGSTSTWLYCTNTNNGTRVGTNTNKTFSIDGTYLKHSGTSRYVGVYNSQDWRCYTSSSTNISGQTLKFYKYVEQSSGGSTETVPSLTQDQFSWSATTATATLPNIFDNPPTLTNTESLAVSYSSSKGEVATIDENGNVTLVGKGETVISATAGDDKTYKKTTVSYTLTVKPAPLAPIAGGVIDILNQAWTGKTNSTYGDVSEKTAENTGHSNAKYVAQCAGDKSSIQLRSNNNNSGVVSTISGGVVKRIEVEWHADTDAARTLQIYGSNTAYTAATDLYGDAKGELLGDLNKGEGETTLDFSEWTGDYKYIGFRSKSGAMYLTTITITWLPINSKVTIDDAIQNGSVSVSGATDLNAVAAGTELTLSNTPATNYKLSAYDVYKTDDATTKVTVTDGKFIMPEHDVTISATFELAKTLTSIEITNNATQTTFWQGEAFNHDGLKVTAHFEGAADEDVTDKVTVNGSTDAAGTQTITVSFKEGEITKTATYQITVKAIPNTKETAYTVADAFDIIDKLGDTDKMYITGFVSQADLEQSSIDQYKNADYWISADGTTNGQQLEAFRGKYLDNTDFTSVDQIMRGDEVIIYGKLTKYGSTYEFAAGNYLVSLKRDKQQPELSYTTTEYEVNLGDVFTAPILNNPHSLAVTYSSNDEDVATVAVDGAVTIKAAGTVTITASFAGDENYVAGEASYTINITDPNVSEATFVAGKDTSEELYISKDGITVAFTVGVFNRTDNYRCHAGKEMTISYNDGTITKIVIECTANDGAEYGPGQFTTETATYSYSGKVGTWTGEAKSVTFASTKQVRMTQITVYYKQDKRANSELTWSEESINLTVGDDFTAPTFNNPNNLAPISFISDNTALATVNNAGVISLKAGAVGTAIITATFAGNETYKDVEVKCTISVSPKTENVVILAQYAGKWYALKAEYVAEKTDRLVALPVEYINGTLYNVADADKALITWERVVIGNKATFKNGDNYLKGKSSTTLIIEGETTGLYQWDYPSYTMVIEGSPTVRTFLYNNTNNCFRNYDITNASNGIDEEKVYSALPVVTAAKFEKATIITRNDLPTGNYGTICYENNITNFAGVTFYAVAGREGRKVIFDEVTELEAGMPYLFRAEATELKMALGNETATSAGKHNSLQGTFIQIDPAEENILTGNYVMYNNMIKKCGKNCGLKANRAYFIGSELESLGAPAPQVPGRKRVSMDVLGEDEATGVDNITENGVVAPALQGTYDVVGRQLVEPATTGFYIVNGKKVLIVK